MAEGLGKGGSVAKRPTNRNDVEIYKIRHATIRKAIDSTFGFLKTTVRAAGWILAFYFLYLAISVISGKTTHFETTVRAVLNLSIDRQVMGIVIFLLGGTAYNERKLRRKTSQNRVDYIRELERRLDPGRSSSLLDSKGRPPIRDRDAD
jgi:hypothetical protein